MSQEALPHQLFISAWWPELRALCTYLCGWKGLPNEGCPISVDDVEIKWLESRRSPLAPLEFSEPSFKVTELSLPKQSPCGKYSFLLTGIGSVSAATRVTRALCSLPKNTEVIFLGTAGAYDSNTELGTAVLCTSTQFTDLALCRTLSYLPEIAMQNLSLKSQLEEVNKTICLTTTGITTDVLVAEEYAKYGDVENLELYGVARAAQEFGTTWRSYLGISNHVGPLAHLQWKENHLKAVLAAADLILR
jgi:nucleoside phosphorylase